MVRSEKWNWDRILLFVILILLMLEIAILLVQNERINEQGCNAPHNLTIREMCLPALPMHYVHENPECTNKLLVAMNITNVRIGNSG